MVSLFFIIIAVSNFQNSEDSFISKKINLGLDLQGGSYLLLEIDNGPVEIQKLQNTTTVIRNFLKDKKITFNDLRIENKNIIFNVSNDNAQLVETFFLDKESDINPYYNQYKSSLQSAHISIGISIPFILTSTWIYAKPVKRPEFD